MTEPTIKSTVLATLMCVGDTPSRGQLRGLGDQPVAVFVCASREDARALARWIYDDVVLEVSARPPAVAVPSAEAPAAPHHPGPIPKGLLELIYALSLAEVHELMLLGVEPRCALQSDPTREAQRSLARAGLALLRSEGPGAPSKDRRYEITPDGQRALRVLAALDVALAPAAP